MFPAGRVSDKLRWQILAVVLACVLLGTAPPQPVQSEPPPTDQGDQLTLLWIDYLEACFRLAEADLKVAELSNRRVNGAVTEYDMQRIRLQRDFIEYARSQMNQGREFGDIFAAYAKLHARLADLDVRSAAEARRNHPGAVSDAQYERCQRAAEMSRLYVAVAQHGGQGESLAESLRNNTDRLTVEIMDLNRRVGRLEELVQR